MSEYIHIYAYVLLYLYIWICVYMYICLNTFLYYVCVYLYIYHISGKLLQTTSQLHLFPFQSSQPVCFISVFQICGTSEIFLTVYSVKTHNVIAVRAWLLARSNLETLSSRMWVQKVNFNEPFPPQLTHHGKKSGAGCFACSSAVGDGDEGWKMCMVLAQLQCLGKLFSGVGKCSGCPWKVIFPLQIDIFLFSNNLSPFDSASNFYCLFWVPCF